MTLWSLLPWAVCFVKHFFSQCQAGITKCDNQMQIICMYNKLNSWTVQMALIFVILNESYYSDLNASLTFKAVHGVLARWLPDPILLLFRTIGILSLISKGTSSDRWCQQQLHHKAILLEKWATLSGSFWPWSTTFSVMALNICRVTSSCSARFLRVFTARVAASRCAAGLIFRCPFPLDWSQSPDRLAVTL